MKTRYDVEEYSFGQTTLEQVFIEFAKLQEAEDDDGGLETKKKVLNRLNSSLSQE